MNIPNAITVARIVLCPLVAWLILLPGLFARYAAAVVFLVAAFSDVWDGHLARKHGWISDTGKLLDPIADKLLMASAFIPFYFTTRRGDGFSELPLWGELPVWVIVLVFGRELFITLFRGYALRRDVVIAAGKSGKYKTLMQNSFIASQLLWLSFLASASQAGWEGGLWGSWQYYHSGFVAAALALTVFLTVFSLADYLWRYRSLVSESQ